MRQLRILFLMRGYELLIFSFFAQGIKQRAALWFASQHAMHRVLAVNGERSDLILGENVKKNGTARQGLVATVIVMSLIVTIENEH